MSILTDGGLLKSVLQCRRFFRFWLFELKSYIKCVCFLEGGQNFTVTHKNFKIVLKWRITIKSQLLSEPTWNMVKEGVKDEINKLFKNQIISCRKKKKNIFCQISMARQTSFTLFIDCIWDSIASIWLSW